MKMQTLALGFLAATALGGIAWVFIYPFLSGEKKAESRRASVARSEPAARAADKNQRSRREQVETSIKDLEARRRKESKVPLSSRLTQAGLDWSTQKFMIVSGILAAACFLVAILSGGGLLSAAGLAFAAGLGLPRWSLSYLKKRREKKFLKALPDAVDVIVRGIKAGLPLFESIKVVAADAPEPLKSEFIAIIETQAIGMPLGEACARLYERMPVPEANFFGIARRCPKKFKRCRWRRRHPRALSAHCPRSSCSWSTSPPPTTSRCCGPTRPVSSCCAAACSGCRAASS